MRSLNHFEAVTVLREAANEVIIRVYREPKEDPDESYSQKNDDQALSEKGPEGQGKVRNNLSLMNTPLTFSVKKWPNFTWGAFDLPESESGFEIMILIHHFI